MGFLDSLFKKSGKGKTIASPAKGTCISLQEVKDATFAEEILGKGAVVVPEEGKFYAPADGTVNTIFPTYHALTMTTTDGVEILIHVGIDTVELQGRYYTSHVEDGAQVKKGDLLLEADLKKIKAEGYETATPVIICNTPDFSVVEPETGKEINAGDALIRLEK